MKDDVVVIREHRWMTEGVAYLSQIKQVRDNYLAQVYLCRPDGTPHEIVSHYFCTTLEKAEHEIRQTTQAIQHLLRTEAVLSTRKTRKQNERKQDSAKGDGQADSVGQPLRGKTRRVSKQRDDGQARTSTAVRKVAKARGNGLGSTENESRWSSIDGKSWSKVIGEYRGDILLVDDKFYMSSIYAVGPTGACEFIIEKPFESIDQAKSFFADYTWSPA